MASWLAGDHDVLADVNIVDEYLQDARKKLAAACVLVAVGVPAFDMQTCTVDQGAYVVAREEAQVRAIQQAAGVFVIPAPLDQQPEEQCDVANIGNAYDGGASRSQQTQVTAQYSPGVD